MRPLASLPTRAARVPAFCAAAALASTAARAAAQTPAADSTAAAAAGAVLSDSLYGFGVRAAEHPKESFVHLLDAMWVRREADGSGTRTVRMVAQVLTPAAVGRWSEFTLPYNADRETLAVDHARVVRPGGAVLSAGPEVDREFDAPTATVDPVYDHVKLRRLTLARVAAGTIVDVQYTVRTTTPPLAGDWVQDWRVTPGFTVRRSFFDVDLPAGVTPRVSAHDLGPDVTATVTDSAGRRRWRWVARDVPRLEPEPFAPPASVDRGEGHVRVGGSATWASIGRWFADLSRDRAATTPEVDAKLAAVTEGARTLGDSLRAVHRYVAGDLRYVSVALGRGAFQPRPPRLVVETGYGDCKDKAMLFVAAARRWGVDAYPVLLYSGRAVAPADIPTAGAFNHVIVAVREPSRRGGAAAPNTTAGGLHFVDPTAAHTPYDELPADDQGQFALVVRPDGRADTLHLPVVPPSANASISRLVATVDTAGHLAGRFVITETGAVASPIRARFWQPMDVTSRAALAAGVARGLFQGAKADSLTFDDPHLLHPEFGFTVNFRDGEAVQRSGTTGVLPLRFGPNGAAFAERLALLRKATGPRRSAIDPRQLVPLGVTAGPIAGASATEWTLTLPAGWTADLPPSVDVRTDFAHFTASFEQRGRELHVVRRAEATADPVPASRLPEVTRFLEAAAKDNAGFLIIHIGAPGTTSASAGQ